MATGFKTGRTAHWGIIESVIGTSIVTATGVITEWNETLGVTTQNELNELGTVIGRVQYDERYDVSCTMQVPQSERAKLIGKDWSPTDAAKVTVGSSSYYVQSANIVQSNKNFMRIQFRLAASRYMGKGGSGKQENNETQTK